MAEKLIDTVEQLLANIVRLHQFGAGSAEEKRFHRGRVKNGKRFVAYTDGSSALFCPSKFAGYADNDLRHAKLLHKRHGTTTSIRISRLLGDPIAPGQTGYDDADRKFLKYCASFGIAPTIWDRPRTYWLIKAHMIEGFSAGAADASDYNEGRLSTVVSRRFERDRRARTACIDHYGARCVVCELDFNDRYGGLGNGFIHVHHLRPLAQIGKPHAVDPIADLRPVCPNCHAMLHWGQELPISIEDLQKRLSGRQC